MYLKDGREIYESDKYPGYFIDANTGAFCDEDGNYIGGNSDNGDKPGDKNDSPPSSHELVFVSKTGRLFYPRKTKAATIGMDSHAARRNVCKQNAPKGHKYIAQGKRQT